MSGSRHGPRLASFPAKKEPGFYYADNGKAPCVRRMREGMPFSGMCRNSRIVLAERFTVSCSVAFAPISDKEKIVRMKNSFFIAVQVFRRPEAGWTCLFGEDVDLPGSLGERC